jgi:type VI secretion system protein VasD
MAAMRARWLMAVAGAILVAGLAAGCASTTKMDLDLTASEDLNPSPEGRPSPLVVRVFELRSPEPFGSADFFALYDDSTQVLGPSLVDHQELELKPGENLRVKRELHPDTQVLGVMAAYRDLDHAHWRELYSLKVGKNNKLRVDLGSLSVSVTEQ